MNSEAVVELVCEIWRQVLEVGEVGEDDDFVELGGDSIAAVQVVEHLKRRLGVQLAPDTVLDSPTLREFTAVVRQRLQA